jgi:hypothetical protein
MTEFGDILEDGDMARTARLAAILGVITLVMAAAAFLLVGCGGDDDNSGRPKLPQAQAYIDEATGEVFGVPLDLPPNKEVFPPILHPETGKPTLVRAYFYADKTSDKPTLYKMEKYTESQIKRFQEHQKTLTEDSPMEQTVEYVFATEGVAAQTKYVGDAKWRRPTQDKPANIVRDEKKRLFKNGIMPVFDEKWRMLKPEEIKQK